MPWSIKVDYICPKCHKPFQSTHYRQPERCPACRKIHRAKRALINYHRRKGEGRESDHKRRDIAYDGVRVGPAPSVYSSGCVIRIKHEYARCPNCDRELRSNFCTSCHKGCKLPRCKSCGQIRDLINGYCDMCRGNCANEAQCHDASGIA